MRSSTTRARTIFQSRAVVLDCRYLISSVPRRGRDEEPRRGVGRPPAMEGRVRVPTNVAWVLEYEAVCGRREHLTAAKFDAVRLAVFVDALAAIAEPMESHFIWCPQRKDPSDEMVLNAAVNGRADAIVTFNQRDYGIVPQRFGVSILLPRDAHRRVSA